MRIAVIGGGAAGFFGAIAAATHDPSAEIAIYEATRHPLDKVRISGGGRCNVTYHCFNPVELVKYYPRGSKELRGLFNRFQPRDTVTWFGQHGVTLKVEDDGRMFPTTDQSKTIVDCLSNAAAKSGVQVRLGAKVKKIAAVSCHRDHPQYEIDIPGRTSERFDKVLIATGGSLHGHEMARALGHTTVPGVPSLFTFKVTDRRLEGLAGVGFENVKLTITCNGKHKLVQAGPMLITHWGLSGPAVLKLSAWGARILHDNNYHADLSISFLPEYDSQQLYEELLAFKLRHGRKKVQTGTLLPVPKRYWLRIMQDTGISEETTWANITKQEMSSIISELTAGQFIVSDKGIFKGEFVTCGGVDLGEVDFNNMQSRCCPGLYFAGEVLNIDGVTGGFNFQSAWTTAWIAGMSMVA